MFASSIAPGWGCYGGVVIRSVLLLIIKVNDIFIFNSLCVLGGKQPKSTKTKSQLRVARSLVPESPVRVVGSIVFNSMAGLPQLGAVTSRCRCRSSLSLSCSRSLSLSLSLPLLVSCLVVSYAGWRCLWVEFVLWVDEWESGRAV